MHALNMREENGPPGVMPLSALKVPCNFSRPGTPILLCPRNNASGEGRRNILGPTPYAAKKIAFAPYQAHHMPSSNPHRFDRADIDHPRPNTEQASPLSRSSLFVAPEFHHGAHHQTWTMLIELPWFSLRPTKTVPKDWFYDNHRHFLVKGQWFPISSAGVRSHAPTWPVSTLQRPIICVPALHHSAPPLHATTFENHTLICALLAVPSWPQRTRQPGALRHWGCCPECRLCQREWEGGLFSRPLFCIWQRVWQSGWRHLARYCGAISCRFVPPLNRNTPIWVQAGTKNSRPDSGRNSTEKPFNPTTTIPQHHHNALWWCRLPLLWRGIYGYSRSDMGNLFRSGRVRVLWIG